MAPWEAFEALSSRNPDTSEKEFSVTSSRILSTGAKIVLSQTLLGMFRKKVINRTVVSIIDDDTAEVTVERPGEPIVNLGEFPNFGMALQSYHLSSAIDSRYLTGQRIITRSFRVHRQDIFVPDGNNPMLIKGVNWLNDGFQKPHPVLMFYGRSLFSDDDPNDPTLKLWQRLEFKKALEEYQRQKK